MISAFNNSLVPPPVQGDPRLLGSLVERSDENLPEPTLTVEQALKIVRIKSYEEGYQDGLRDGKKEGYRDAIAALHNPSALVVKDKDALGHGSYKRGTARPTSTAAASHRAIDRLKKVGSAALNSRVARFFVKAEHKLMIVAHKTRDIAEHAAKRRKPPFDERQTARLKRVLFIADFLGGYATGAAGAAIGGVVGAKIGMLLPSASALYVAYSTIRDPVAVWSAARDVVKETLRFASTVKAFLPGNDDPGASFADLMADLLDVSPEQADWREAVFLAALADGLAPNKAMDIARHAGEMPSDDDLPEPQEEDFGFEEGINAKALRNRMKKRQWISAKIAIIMKDGIRGHAVSQAQAVAVAHKLWNKKRNRRRPPSEAKAMDVVWFMTGGISVDAERLQFKKTDGAEDGLNDERRNEDMDREFNPLEVPPIAVWKASDGQVYVVDGHKRLDHAKRKGVPTIRAFFIEAETFEEAKKKGELLNEKMGTKAFDALEAAIILKAKDAKGHEHKGKGPGGGQFTSKEGGGTDHGKILVKADPSKIGERYHDLTQENGAPVRGTPISADDPRIPDTVYHVTTNHSAVKSSGYLRAGGVGGLGGDTRDQIVSMTINKDVAESLLRDMKFVSGIARSTTTPPDRKWNKETSKWEGDRTAWGKALVEKLNSTAKDEGWEGYKPVDLQLQSYNFDDHIKSYFSAREQETKGKYKDPLFYDAYGSMSKVDPENVGLISIPKEHLNTGALLTDFDLDNPYGLQEVRLYGNVPLSKPVETKAFSEGEHPRGQPDNAGQFVKKV